MDGYRIDAAKHLAESAYAFSRDNAERMFVATYLDPDTAIDVKTHDEVVRYMLAIVWRPSISISGIKQRVKKIVLLTVGGISHTLVLNMLARLMGYQNWPEARNLFIKDLNTTKRRTEGLLILYTRLSDKERSQYAMTAQTVWHSYVTSTEPTMESK